MCALCKVTDMSRTTSHDNMTEVRRLSLPQSLCLLCCGEEHIMPSSDIQVPKLCGSKGFVIFHSQLFVYCVHYSIPFYAVILLK